LLALRERLVGRQRDQAAQRPSVEGFSEATFGTVLKGFTGLSNGNLRVVMEIPYAETDAFLATRKAFEIELTCTLRRKSTQADPRPADPAGD
jgi:hypothetical protein